jgi:hypothetical protein
MITIASTMGLSYVKIKEKPIIILENKDNVWHMMALVHMLYGNALSHITFISMPASNELKQGSLKEGVLEMRHNKIVIQGNLEIKDISVTLHDVIKRSRNDALDVYFKNFLKMNEV